MDVKIASDWKEILSEEFEKPYFRELTDFATFFVPATYAGSTNS